MKEGTKKILEMTGFGNLVKLVEQGMCPICGNKVDTSAFDELGLKEFNISGMCKKCQDDVFGKDE